ncbi:hypothetical protein A9Q02_14020 [Candidatus Chloroploca asiatica]|uniref:Uncharacterized protein n=1 Tax=Candidatus Chloroploca asiatica TaxID=1506545 RepID=A0A2H3KUG3_9CHLR|nr:hypothetical protein A9Q02_14020 [Candidatus Chloroploca asiatica]
MQLTTVTVINGHLAAAEDTVPSTLAVAPHAPDAPRGLFVTLVSVEDAAYDLAYAAVICGALHLDAAQRPVAVDLLHPLTTLTLVEQATLRNHLIQQAWRAWARAPHHVRTLLGCPAAPLRLADAARQLGYPLPTLAKAAAEDRLPTIHVGDRHLVYLATVTEAHDRGLLHDQRGRPPRKRTPRR